MTFIGHSKERTMQGVQTGPIKCAYCDTTTDNVKHGWSHPAGGPLACPECTKAYNDFVEIAKESILEDLRRGDHLV